MANDTLLLLSKAAQRLGAEINRLAPNVDLLIMQEDAGYQLNGQAIADPPEPTLAWMGLDLYQSKCAAEFLAAVSDAPKLRWVQTALAGIEAPIFRQLIERGVRLTNSDAQAPSIADFVLGNVLATLQSFSHLRELQRARRWQPVPFKELGRTRWLVVGFGSIGQELAQRLQGFGATVVGVRRTATQSPYANVVAPDALTAELPKADVVVLACALNDQSRGMVDAEFLAQMRAESILVNVGRGALIVDADLLSALDNDRPAHAILDVFDPEPLPEDNAYWSHPKVLVSSHTSAFGDGMAERGDALFLGNLQRLLAGEPLHKEVTAID